MRRFFLFTSSVAMLTLVACGTQTPLPACPEWPEDCETYDGFVVHGNNDTVVVTESSRPQPNPGYTPERPVEAPTAPVDDSAIPTPETPSEPPSEPPSESQGHSHGNASANNGKGGNYDRTGHEDNGKGNGKGRRE